MRKWASRELHYNTLASQADRYIRECTGRDADSIEKNIFYRNCYCFFKAMAERANRKYEKWSNKLYSTSDESSDSSVSPTSSEDYPK